MNIKQTPAIENGDRPKYIPYSIGDPRFDSLGFSERQHIDSEMGSFEQEAKMLDTRLKELFGRILSRNRIADLADGTLDAESFFAVVMDELKAKALENQGVQKAVEVLHEYASVIKRAKETGYLDKVSEGNTAVAGVVPESE